MSGRYAAETQVPADRSRAEIERTLARYGADAFMYGWDGDQAVVRFRAAGRMIQFTVGMPPLSDFRYTSGAKMMPRARERSTEQVAEAREKAMRQRWRALALVIKAKLEAVESGITTFESEFLAHVLLPDGTTFGEWATPEIERVYETGEMPKMLPQLTAG